MNTGNVDQIDEINIEEITYLNCAIRVQKNYNYEEPILLQNPQYIQLMKSRKIMSRIHLFVEKRQRWRIFLLLYR